MDIIDIVEIMDRKGDVMGITKGIYNQQYMYDIPTNHPWLDGWYETNKHNWGHQSSICSWKHPKSIDCWTWKPTKQCLVGAFKIILPDGFGTCCNSLFFRPKIRELPIPFPGPKGPYPLRHFFPRPFRWSSCAWLQKKICGPPCSGPGWLKESTAIGASSSSIAGSAE